VDRGGEHDNEAFDDELEFDRKAEDDDDVENQDEYQGAEQSPCDGANTARQGNATDDGRDDRIELEAPSDPIIDRADMSEEMI